jgi:D-glycero-alpha-D-manno-heptose-7-phosphate kinase
MISKARSPCRIGLAGGGSDIKAFYKEYGGAVMNVGISLYSYCSMEKLYEGERYTEITAPDWGFNRRITDTELEFEANNKTNVDIIKAVMMKYKIDPKEGYRFSLSSQAPKNSGLAGSSALLCSIMGSVFSQVNRPMINKARISREAIDIERSILKRYGGDQDQWASVYGGFNFIEFSKNETSICPLRLEDSMLAEFHSSMLLFELPIQRKVSASVIEKKKIDNMENNIETLMKIREGAYAMRHHLLRGDMEALGIIVDGCWELKKKLEGVSNKDIDHYYKIGMKAGAFGGKLCGAGGGGSIFYIAPFENRANIIKKMSREGCKNIPFDFDEKGMVAWRTG